jgi:hypothetical protein
VASSQQPTPQKITWRPPGPADPALTIAAMIGAFWISGVILVGDDRSPAETTGAAHTERDARAALVRVVLASACWGRVGVGPAPGR